MFFGRGVARDGVVLWVDAGRWVDSGGAALRQPRRVCLRGVLGVAVEQLAWVEDHEAGLVGGRGGEAAEA